MTYVLVANVAERLEEVTFLNIKPRRLLKGNQAKMLCCDWSPDKRHIVSSSQVHNRLKFINVQKCLIKYACLVLVHTNARMVNY